MHLSAWATIRKKRASLARWFNCCAICCSPLSLKDTATFRPCFFNSVNARSVARKSPRIKRSTGAFSAIAFFVSRWTDPNVHAAKAWKLIGGCAVAFGAVPSSKYCSGSRPPGLRTLSRKSAASSDAILLVGIARRRCRRFQQRVVVHFVQRSNRYGAPDLDRLFRLFFCRFDGNRLQNRFAVFRLFID